MITLIRFALLSAALMALAVPARADNVLWTKTVTFEHGSPTYRVGSDGSVFLADAQKNGQKLWWYDREGNVIGQLPALQNIDLLGCIYITKDELILSTRDADKVISMELYQVTGPGQIEHTVRTGSYVSMIPGSFGLEYPYAVDVATVAANTYSFTLVDLTSQNSLKLVGDAVIGVHGKNMQIRWKTVQNSKYKVQTSTDLATWTDYGDVMDGMAAPW